MKCPTIHEPGQCKVTRDDNKSLVYCTNCKNYGHPASYKGCPYIKEAPQKSYHAPKQVSWTNSQTQPPNTTPVTLTMMTPANPLRECKHDYASVVKINTTNNIKSKQCLLDNKNVYNVNKDDRCDKMSHVYEVNDQGNDSNLTNALSNILNNFKVEIANLVDNYNKNLLNKINSNSNDIRMLSERMGIPLNRDSP